MTNVTTATTIAALQSSPTGSGAVTYLTQPGREGAFVWTLGNFTAQAASDPQTGIYVPSTVTALTSGCWVRDWDGVNGKPEWFGAKTGVPTFDNRQAFDACVALCQTMLLGPDDYYIQDVWKWSTSGRQLIGTAGSGSSRGYLTDASLPMGTADGTRIILSGPNVVSATVAVIGRDNPLPTDDTLLQMRNCTARDIKFARDCSVFKPRPSTSADSINCVKGVIVAGCSDCVFTNLKSFDSPVGFHMFNNVFTKCYDFNTKRNTPASSPTNDFWIGYLVGGYGTNPYGLGANSSLYLIGCTVFDKHPDFDTAVGLRLFGKFIDTFIWKFEQARMDIGVEIDGRTAAGITDSAWGAHQDVIFSDGILDSNDSHAMLIHNTNDSFMLDMDNMYTAVLPNQQSLVMQNVAGQVNITGGRWMGGGLTAVNVNGLQMLGVSIRDAIVPIYLESVGMSNIQAQVFNYQTSCVSGVRMVGCYRNNIAPIIRGAPGRIAHGIDMNSASALNAINGSMIDPGAFTTVSASFKVLFNGADASTGAGASGFTAAGNVLMGPVG